MVAARERSGINPDALYPLPKVGELLGLSRNDVSVLITNGALKAKWRKVRGKQGRKVVLGSEIQRYMRELPDVAVEEKTPELVVANAPALRKRPPRALKLARVKLNIKRW